MVVCKWTGQVSSSAPFAVGTPVAVCDKAHAAAGYELMSDSFACVPSLAMS